MVKHGETARFIEPMECLPVENVPEGDIWTYELKLDGYRLLAVKAVGKVTFYSRRGSDLTKRFPYVATDLASLPDDTVVDGELVALYAFDILIHEGRDVTQLPLSKRRAILARAVESRDHAGLSQVSNRTAAEMIHFVRSHGLEGVVAKRADSPYQPGSAAACGRKRGRISVRSASLAVTSRAILESIRLSSAFTKAKTSITPHV